MTPTFQERIDRVKAGLRGIGNFAGTPDADDVAEECGMVASAVTDLADLVGVLADLTGNRPASEAASKLPSHGGTMEFKVTVQAAADSADPRGTMELEGTNFSDIVLEAHSRGYPRVIAAAQREVTEWQAVTGYPFAEATP